MKELQLLYKELQASNIIIKEYNYFESLEKIIFDIEKVIEYDPKLNERKKIVISKEIIENQRIKINHFHFIDLKKESERFDYLEKIMVELIKLYETCEEYEFKITDINIIFVNCYDKFNYIIEAIDKKYQEFDKKRQAFKKEVDLKEFENHLKEIMSISNFLITGELCEIVFFAGKTLLDKEDNFENTEKQLIFQENLNFFSKKYNLNEKELMRKRTQTKNNLILIPYLKKRKLDNENYHVITNDEENLKLRLKDTLENNIFLKKNSNYPLNESIEYLTENNCEEFYVDLLEKHAENYRISMKFFNSGYDFDVFEESNSKNEKEDIYKMEIEIPYQNCKLIEDIILNYLNLLNADNSNKKKITIDKKKKSNIVF